MCAAIVVHTKTTQHIRSLHLPVCSHYKEQLSIGLPSERTENMLVLICRSDEPDSRQGIGCPSVMVSSLSCPFFLASSLAPNGMQQHMTEKLKRIKAVTLGGARNKRYVWLFISIVGRNWSLCHCAATHHKVAQDGAVREELATVESTWTGGSISRSKFQKPRKRRVTHSYSV